MDAFMHKVCIPVFHHLKSGFARLSLETCWLHEAMEENVSSSGMMK